LPLAGDSFNGERVPVASPGPRAPARFRREGYRRRQLFWFTWIRIALLTTALVTTLLLLSFASKPESVPMEHVRGLYAVFVLGYALSAVNLAALGLTKSDALVAGTQFVGDMVLVTGLFVALVPSLGYDGAVAVVLPLFALVTAFACTHLDRIRGAAFAMGAFLLQAFVHLAPSWRLVPAHVLGLDDLAAAEPRTLTLYLFVLMFTFFGTAWTTASRAERLNATEVRLHGVAEDLAELQAFNEHVVRSISAGLVTTDHAGRITFVNAAAQDILGGRPEVLRGRPLFDVLGWHDEMTDLHAALGEGRTRRFERDALLENRRVYLEVTASRLEDRARNVLGILYLLEDTTEIRLLEREVRLKEKMAAIGEMAAGLAHEIRNPLASISGSIQILDRQLPLEGDRRQLMGIVLSEARRLDDTVRDFLDFARPREIRARTVDVAELARETVLLLSHSEQVCPDHVLTAPPRGMSASVHADADQLRQVLWNLCTNALKAMPDGGRLAVEVARAGTEASLCVSDTGVGMSKEMLARVFEPLAGEFPGGSGLGMAIVYRIVRDHGGRIRIDSAPGAGTRVEVRLPAGTPAVAAGGAA